MLTEPERVYTLRKCTSPGTKRSARPILRTTAWTSLTPEKVFEGPTFTYEDDRIDYGERRFVTLGFLGRVVVSIVHTETQDEIRVISCRKATTKEQAILFQNLED